MFFGECQRFFHVGSRAMAHTLKSQILDHQLRNRNRRSRKIHDPDYGNMSSPRCRLDRPGYSVSSDDIKDLVGTPSVGEAKYNLIPCGVHTRIDNLCGTQLFQTRNLAWACRSH